MSNNTLRRPLFKLSYRQGSSPSPTTYVSVVTQRGGFITKSSEKVLPLIAVYNAEGLVSLNGPREIMAGYHPHPYRPNGADFTPERIADANVAKLQQHLAHYPTLTEYLVNGQSVSHPIAQYIYDNTLYLKPTDEFNVALSQMNFLERGQVQAQALEIMNNQLKAQYGLSVDLYSVPKRKVGTKAYYASPSGIAIAPAVLSFGLHRAIPTDRIARELSAIKSAEPFLSPVPAPHPCPIPSFALPFVSWVRTAVIFPKTSMLDSADISPSAQQKLACKLEKRVEYRDISQIEESKRNIQPRNYRAGIELVHEEIQVTDESEVGIPCVKFVFPGGVKVVGQTVTEEYQARDEHGECVDLVMDFETFAAKGAMAVLAAMIEPTLWDSKPTYADCEKVFDEYIAKNVYTRVTVRDAQYDAIVGYLPAIRTRHRHTESNKGTNYIGSDLVSQSILQQPFHVHPRVEEEYQELVQFRKQVGNLLEGLESVCY